MDLYETLGVEKDATQEEIVAAGRKKAKATHPDAGGDPEAFHRVSRAMTVLRDAAKRAKYDETGSEGDALMGEDAEAMTLLSQQFQQIIHTPGLDLERTNLTAGVRAALGAMIQGAEQFIGGHEASIVRLEKVRKRLKRKAGAEGPNHLDKILDGQIRERRGGIEGARRNIRVVNKAIELIGQYEYEVDTTPQRPAFNVGRGTGWIG